ncbi:hypothetical protein BJX99DRAFT_264393 [Aspergillus californicus]
MADDEDPQTRPIFPPEDADIEPLRPPSDPSGSSTSSPAVPVLTPPPSSEDPGSTRANSPIHNNPTGTFPARPPGVKSDSTPGPSDSRKSTAGIPVEAQGPYRFIKNLYDSFVANEHPLTRTMAGFGAGRGHNLNRERVQVDTPVQNQEQVQDLQLLSDPERLERSLRNDARARESRVMQRVILDLSTRIRRSQEQEREESRGRSQHRDQVRRESPGSNDTRLEIAHSEARHAYYETCAEYERTLEEEGEYACSV